MKVSSEGTSDRQGNRQVAIPRRVQRTRKASQEDALASARYFFASENEQCRTIPLGSSEEVPTATTGGTTLNTSMLAVSSTVPTTLTTPTITGADTGSPRSFLPNGAPPRPTVTATHRPQTWVQRISEGYVPAPPPDGTE